jgi:hypothetical protein
MVSGLARVASRLVTPSGGISERRSVQGGDMALDQVCLADVREWQVAYVARHALAVQGPIREYYLVGQHDTADTSQWRTEIGWPTIALCYDAGGGVAGAGLRIRAASRASVRVGVPAGP